MSKDVEKKPESNCEGCREGCPIQGDNEHYSHDGLPFMYCEDES